MARRRQAHELRRAAIAGDTFDVLYENYGETMTLGDICGVMNCSKKSGYNQLYRGTFPIELFKNTAGRWVAMTGEVAVFIDKQRRGTMT